MNVVEPLLPEVKRGVFPNVGPQQVADRPVDLNRMFGKLDPKDFQVQKFENANQRAGAYLLAAGRSQKEAAAACEVSEETVRRWVRNPWYQQTIFEIQKENGATDIMEMFKGECMNSLTRLIELRDSPKTPASVAATVSFGILHQVLGKPTQRVETKDVPTSDDPVAEVARLEAENARLQSSSATSHAGAEGSSPLAEVPQERPKFPPPAGP